MAIAIERISLVKYNLDPLSAMAVIMKDTLKQVLGRGEMRNISQVPLSPKNVHAGPYWKESAVHDIA